LEFLFGFWSIEFSFIKRDLDAERLYSAAGAVMNGIGRIVFAPKLKERLNGGKVLLTFEDRSAFEDVCKVFAGIGGARKLDDHQSQRKRQ